jgi:hypothetical protein
MGARDVEVWVYLGSRRELSASRSGPFTPAKRTPVHIEEGAGYVPGSVWMI